MVRGTILTKRSFRDVEGEDEEDSGSKKKKKVAEFAEPTMETGSQPRRQQ